MCQVCIRSILFLLLSLLIGCDLPSTGNADAELETGIRLQEQRRFAEAIPHLQKALDASSDAATRSNLLTTIGNCHTELDEFDEALKFHDRAIAANPRNHKAHVNKGIVYRAMNEYDKAARSYALALNLAPDYAELHASLGTLAIAQGEYDKAVEHLERAVSLDDSLAVSHSNLAVAYAFVGRFDEADEELQKAIDLGYHQPDVIRKWIDDLRANCVD